MKYSKKVVVVALCVAVSLPLFAERRRAVARQPDRLSIEFVDIPAPGATVLPAGSDAWIDFNTVSQKAGSTGKSVRVRREFGIRIVRAGGVSWGTARVSARLDTLDGRSSLRLDGQLLTGAPLLIDARAAVGSMKLHTLEIEVRDSVPAGPLAASIFWEVIAQ